MNASSEIIYILEAQCTAQVGPATAEERGHGRLAASPATNWGVERGAGGRTSQREGPQAVCIIATGYSGILVPWLLYIEISQAFSRDKGLNSLALSS